MELNGDKLECLRYGQDKQLQRDTQYTSNKGLQIQQKDRVKDLGVTMDRNGTFKAHIENSVIAANKMGTKDLQYKRTSTHANSLEISHPVQA